MIRPLRVYFGGSVTPSEHAYVAACFAHTARQARNLMWRQSDRLTEDCDWNITYARVAWQRGLSGMAESLGVTEPRMIDDTKTQRAMGWSCEGDSRCANCDLAEFDGDYPLCEHCEQCEECGHHHDCPEHGKAGGE